ncbi:radical SAM protein [Vibrio cincinnatiensis]|uniref:radical SAM protein n=1 Tax=Vibrio cincinnatiensis TaxID=675 RepID=UPI001EDFE357|nr:radical SAM protein [Vibrio cincinnatiensis]MCG3723681.1 radical SAM protein [Vibrio cincinnatiensis]
MKISRFKKPLCAQPFTLWNMKTEGWRACCNRHLLPQNLPGNPWNSRYQREFRKKMFSKETLPEVCHSCLHYGYNSAKKYGGEFNPETYDFNTGAMLGEIEVMQYFLGNKCNLACDTCDTEHSIMHGKVFPERAIKVEKVISVDQISEILLHQPKSVVVYGGEPFVYRNLNDDLVTILDNTNAIVSILTNGSYDLVENGFWENIIQKYPKRIVMVFSLDGTRELNEKIRRGLDHNILEKNIDLCAKNMALLHFANVHVTLSTMNIDNLQDIFQWWLGRALKGSRHLFDLCAIVKPHDMALHNLPRNVRLDYAYQFKNYLNDVVLPAVKDIKAKWVADSAVLSFKELITALETDHAPSEVYGTNLNPIEVKIIE